MSTRRHQQQPAMPQLPPFATKWVGARLDTNQSWTFERRAGGDAAAGVWVETTPASAAAQTPAEWHSVAETETSVLLVGAPALSGAAAPLTGKFLVLSCTGAYSLSLDAVPSQVPLAQGSFPALQRTPTGAPVARVWLPTVLDEASRHQLARDITGVAMWASTYAEQDPSRRPVLALVIPRDGVRESSSEKESDEQAVLSHRGLLDACRRATTDQISWVVQREDGAAPPAASGPPSVADGATSVRDILISLGVPAAADLPMGAVAATSAPPFGASSIAAATEGGAAAADRPQHRDAAFAAARPLRPLHPRSRQQARLLFGSAYSPSPNEQLLQPQTSSAWKIQSGVPPIAPSQVTVFFATNRARSDPSDPSFPFQNGVSAASTSYGLATVPSSSLDGNNTDELLAAQSGTVCTLYENAQAFLDALVAAPNPFQSQPTPPGANDTRYILLTHGFNVAFEDAVIQAARLSMTLAQHPAASTAPTVVILFSWPSWASTARYSSDFNDGAPGAVGPLISLLQALLSRIAANRIGLLAHSMGNVVLCSALQQQWEKAAAASVAGAKVCWLFIMHAAADVSHDAVASSAQIVRSMSVSADADGTPVIVLGCKDDFALALSYRVHLWTRRCGTQPFAMSSCHTTLCVSTKTAQEADPSNLHTYYCSPPVIDVLTRLLHGQRVDDMAADVLMPPAAAPDFPVPATDWTAESQAYYAGFWMLRDDFVEYSGGSEEPAAAMQRSEGHPPAAKLPGPKAPAKPAAKLPGAKAKN